jgi:tRNA(Ile)-lysidine synthase
MGHERRGHESQAALLPAAVRAAVSRQRLVDPGDHVLVGVSGGPDSVALLHALVLLRSEFALRLSVGHVHHGLRPEADRDAAFVEALAARLECPAHVVRIQVPRLPGRSPEEAARLARHAALEEVARATGAERIALGHTAEDQAETVLMRILQGAGPRGLAGIPARRGRIVRPLLDISRAMVLAHLAAHRLEVVEDATNRDTKYLRNKVRHEVLPLLTAEAGARVPDALRRVARVSREAVEALDGLVRPRLAGQLTLTPVGWRLALSAFEGLPLGAVKALVRLALVEVAAADRLGSGLRAAHLDALAGLRAAVVGARVRLPGGVVVERGRDALWLLRPDLPGEPTPLAVPGGARVADRATVTATLEAPVADRSVDTAWEAWFDAEALGLGWGPAASPVVPLLIRPRRPGERMIPFGGSGPVRLAKLLATAGVPRHARAPWPVLTRAGAPGDGEILWLLGIRRSAVAPITPRTRLALHLHASLGQSLIQSRRRWPF